MPDSRAKTYRKSKRNNRNNSSTRRIAYAKLQKIISKKERKKYSTSKMKQPLQSRRQTKLQKGEGRENPVKGERERKRERKQEKDSRVEEQVSKKEREIWVRGWTGRNIDPTTSR